MPDSSLSSGGRGRGKRRVPPALRASFAHGGHGGSPTMGFTIPGAQGGAGVGSYSTDGMASPYGASPYGPGMYGTSLGNGVPMTLGPK